MLKKVRKSFQTYTTKSGSIYKNKIKQNTKDMEIRVHASQFERGLIGIQLSTYFKEA